MSILSTLRLWLESVPCKQLSLRNNNRKYLKIIQQNLSTSEEDFLLLFTPMHNNMLQQQWGGLFKIFSPTLATLTISFSLFTFHYLFYLIFKRFLLLIFFFPILMIFPSLLTFLMM